MSEEKTTVENNGRQEAEDLKELLQIRRDKLSALQEAGPEDVILAFGSLSYLHQVKEAYDRTVTDGNKTTADGNSSCLSGKERGRDL